MKIGGSQMLAVDSTAKSQDLEPSSNEVYTTHQRYQSGCPNWTI